MNRSGVNPSGAMQLVRLDDYQSWQIRFGGSTVLVDPWLTNDPVTGAIRRLHREGFTTLAEITPTDDVRAEGTSTRSTFAGVLLCTAEPDHFHADTLKLLADVPIHGTLASAKAARSIGCTSTHAHRVGDTFDITCADSSTLRITVTPTGAPLDRVAHGFVIDAIDSHGSSRGRIWIDGHRPLLSVADDIAPVDVAVLPTQSVMAVVIPVTSGPRRVARVALACGAQTLVPTATDPRRDMTWWQRCLYVVRGGTRSVAALLAGSHVQVADLEPGEAFDVRSPLSD